MSAVSSEDEHSLADSATKVEDVRPRDSRPLSSARLRLTFDDKARDDGDTDSLSGAASPRSAVDVAVPVASQSPRRQSGAVVSPGRSSGAEVSTSLPSPRRLASQPPAATAPELRGEERVQLHEQLAALKEALLASKKEAADARYLADIRAREVAAMKNELKAREIAFDRETERAQVLDEKLLVRAARVESLERDLVEANEELERRNLLISNLRANGRQSLTGDLTRLVASMGPGGTGRQKEVIMSLAKELEHERDANEAHQQRVQFMATQLSETERRAKADLHLRDATVELCRAQNVQLRERLHAARVAAGADPNLLAELEALKREYFQALGVGMKLNLAMQGETANLDLRSLFDQYCSVPFTHWNKILSLELARELNPERNDAIAAQLLDIVNTAK